MKIAIVLAAAYLICLVSTRMASGAQDAKYFRGASATRPATRWEEAFLTGNGRMGVMMFGNPYDETVVLNHCRLYLPLGSREIVPDLAPFFHEIKASALKAGKDGPAVAHRLMTQQAGAQGLRGTTPTDPFHPAFILRLKMAGNAEEVKNYRMTEGFETGELVVRWTDDRGDWERKIFASRPDNVVVMSIAGPRGGVGCELGMDISHALVKSEISADKEWLTSHCVYVKGKGGYDSAIRVTAEGGKIESGEGKITVAGADRILLIMRVDTWKTPLPGSDAWAYSPKNPEFAKAPKTNLLADIRESLTNLPADYVKLFTPHARAHGELFKRVSLDVGGGEDRKVLTEELLDRAAKTNAFTPALMERMYDACRYLIICSSGDVVPNLQGIWTGTWKPAWSGDWTLDSNLQLEIQSMISANLIEFMESYFRLVESWLPDCRHNAKRVYGCRGVVSNARASNNCLLIHWGEKGWVAEQFIGGLGWMAHFFYDYYLFTGDREFLAKRTVPLLKEIALFYEDLLAGTEDDDGNYRFFISYSPEHGMTANTTFDISVAKAVLTYLIKSCEVLSIEKGNVRKWKAMLDKMPPYLINKGGGLQEWSWPGAGEDYNQRHHSHFLPLYQFCEFDRDRTPALWKASGVAFEHKVQQWLRRAKGSNSNHITHGMANQGQCAARLRRGDVVYEVLSRMATRQYLYPSFMISYWPDLKGFGFDPVGTIPDIVNNSLVFSRDGVVDLLPALPKQWPKGSITGILARGQIQIHKLTWDSPAGRIDLTLTSGIAQTITLRMPLASRITFMKVIEGKATVKELPGRGNCRELALPAEQAVRVEITFKDTMASSP